MPPLGVPWFVVGSSAAISHWKGMCRFSLLELDYAFDNCVAHSFKVVLKSVEFFSKWICMVVFVVALQA